MITQTTGMKLELVAIDRQTRTLAGATELTLSFPGPEIELAAASLTVQPRAGAAHSAGLHLSGKIFSGVCDITPGERGVIDEVQLYEGYDRLLATLPLAVAKRDSNDVTRPYPYKGSFDIQFPLDKLEPGQHSFRLLAVDKVFGRCGDFELRFHVERPDETDAGGPVVSVKARRLDHLTAHREYFFQPFLVRVRTKPETMSSGEILIHTRHGDRRVVELDGNRYLADAAGVQPETVLLVTGDDPDAFPPSFGKPSPFRTGAGEAPFRYEADLRRFKQGFRFGFCEAGLLLVGAGNILATLTLDRRAPLAIDDSLSFTWDWGAKTGAVGPSSLASNLPLVDRVAEILFDVIQENQGADTLLAAVSGNWEKLGLQFHPEEHRRLLEYGAEQFEDCGAEFAEKPSAECGRLLGATYRDFLTALAPMTDPVRAARQVAMLKTEFLQAQRRNTRGGVRRLATWVKQWLPS